MIFNAHVKFHTLGQGEIQNAIIERVAGAAGGGSLPTGVAGRICYNTDDNLYYFHNGTVWSQFGGGPGSSLQAEVDAIESASGGVFDTDGTYGGTTVDAALSNVNSSTDLLDALSQLDSAISVAAGVDQIHELTDVDNGATSTAVAGDFLVFNGSAWDNNGFGTEPTDNYLLQYNATNNNWDAVAPATIGSNSFSSIQSDGALISADVLNDTLSIIGGANGGVATAGIDSPDRIEISITGMDLAAGSATLAGGDYIIVNDSADIASTVSLRYTFDEMMQDLDIVHGVTSLGFLVRNGDDSYTARSIGVFGAGVYDGLYIEEGAGQGDDAAIGLDVAGLAAAAGNPAMTDVLIMNDGLANEKVTLTQLTATIGANTALGGLSDVADGNGGTTVDADSYMFSGNATNDGYDVIDATLGVLNNVATGVDSASNEDVLAFDGSSWTAITPATFAADVTLGDLGDVTDGASYAANLYGLVGNGADDWAVTAINLGTLNNVTDNATTNHILYADSNSTWVSAAPGATSGVQAHDAALDALAGLTVISGDIIYATGTDAFAAAQPGATSGVQAHDLDLDNLAGIDAGWVDGGFLVGNGGVEGSRFGIESGATARTSMGLGNIATMDENDFVRTDGSNVLTADWDLGGTYVIKGSPLPSNSTDLASKAYVDSQAGGLTWIDPVWFVDLVRDDIPTGLSIRDLNGATDTTEVADAESTDMYICNADNTTFRAIGSTGNIANLLTGGTGTASSFGPGDVVRYDGDDSNAGLNPTWEYIGHMSDTAVFPVDAYWGVCTVTDATAGGTFAAKEGYVYKMTASATAGNNDATWVASTAMPSGPLDTQTFLVNNPNSGNAFKQFTFVGTYAQATYPGANTNKWLQVGATASITDGIGLAFNGNVLNVNLGAGIKENPLDEVAVELYNDTTGAIILTTDGTSREVDDSASGLHLLLDTTAKGGLVQSAAGLKVDDNQVTMTQLDGSTLAGDGLQTTGSGDTSAFYVATNTASGVVITSDEVALASVPNTSLANSGITYTGTDASSDAVALGETLTFAKGTSPVNLAIATNVATFSIDDATTSDKGIASFDANDFEVNTGVVSVKAAGIGNAQLENSTITPSADTGSATAVSLGGTMTFTGGEGIDTSVSGTVVTIDAEQASDTNLGVASFDSGDFTVTAGNVTINTIGNGQLSNSKIVLSADAGTDQDLDLGNTLTVNGTTADGTNLGVTTTASATDTLTIAVTGETNNLTDVTAAATAEGQVMVADGSNDYTPRQICHVYSGTTASLTHTVTHGLGQQYLNVTVVDATNNVIIPQSITMNATSVVVTFNASIACKVICMGVAGASTSSN